MNIISIFQPKIFLKKIISHIEDFIDSKEVGKTEFKNGKDFEKLAKKLGI